MTAIVLGALAGTAMGYALQRGQLCFHAVWSGALQRSYGLARAWLFGVMIGAVGLTAVYASDAWGQLNDGLAFRPARNVVGGLLIGIGMVIALSCTSGLFFKLGAGMLGALAGIAAWALGDGWVGPALRDRVSDRTVLEGGEGATVPGWLGVPRWSVAVPLALVVGALLFARGGARRDAPAKSWQWGWPVAGIGLGVALVVGWVLAGIGDASFGPSTVGAVSRWVDGDPNDWLVAFVGFLVAGAFIAARMRGGWWLRGEVAARIGGLAAGGLLLGAGGQVGGGCNLGHGLSGVAQLNVSSWVVVISIMTGIGMTRMVWSAIATRAPRAPELGPVTP